MLLLVEPKPDEAMRLAQQVQADIVQLHGQEQPALVSAIKAGSALELWKAVPVRSPRDIEQATQWHGLADMILYDAKPPAGSELPGGNGLRFDWTLLAGRSHIMPWGLSGGLDPTNVGEAIRVTGAPLVDVSTGVESAPGEKDMDKIAAFLKAAGR